MRPRGQRTNAGNEIMRVVLICRLHAEDCTRSIKCIRLHMTTTSPGEKIVLRMPVPQMPQNACVNSVPRSSQFPANDRQFERKNEANNPHSYNWTLALLSISSPARIWRRLLLLTLLQPLLLLEYASYSWSIAGSGYEATYHCIL